MLDNEPWIMGTPHGVPIPVRVVVGTLVRVSNSRNDSHVTPQVSRNHVEIHKP